MERKWNAPPSLAVLTIRSDYRAIRKTCVINPSRRFMEDFLGDEGGVVREAVGENLSVRSKNGSVNIDVSLVDEARDEAREVEGGGNYFGVMVAATPCRAELDVRSKNGDITIRLTSSTIVPYALTASSENGSIALAIPSSFSGPVLLSAPTGTYTFSQGIIARTPAFLKVDERPLCFIGDVRTFSGLKTWTGSVIDASSSHSCLKLSLVDEKPISKKGFLGKLLHK